MGDNSNIQMLNSIYRGAVTGEQATNDILTKTEDSEFRSDLKTQVMGFVDISGEAEQKLKDLGEKPKEISTVQKTGMKMGISMNTIANSETGHLAELMIKGSNNGIINMTKVINEYPTATDDVKGLAQKLITFEQNNIEKFKTYLK